MIMFTIPFSFQVVHLLALRTLSHRSATRRVKALTLDPAKSTGSVIEIVNGPMRSLTHLDLSMERSVEQVRKLYNFLMRHLLLTHGIVV